MTTRHPPPGPRRPLRAVDDVWLQMDQPDNLMVVESLMIVEGQVDVDRLRRLVTERVVEHYPVFRQRPVRGSWARTTHSWEDDPDFDLDRHVLESTLPEPGDEAALEDYIAHLLSRAIDRGHPLWEVHLVHGLEQGSAVYSRLHHAMADGMALTRVALALTDLVADTDLGPARAEVEQPPHPASSPTTSRGVVARLGDLAGDARALALEAAAAVPQLAHLTLAPRPRGPLAATPHHAKRAVWAPPIPLATLAHIGARTGTTVTDVAMSVLAGALRTWLAAHGADTTRDVATMVPVDLRRRGVPLPVELGNKFALVLLDLPVSVATPLGRLEATRTRMAEIKSSPQARLTYTMLQVMGLPTARARGLVTGYFGAKATGVTTSVRGPAVPLWLAGCRVERMLGWAPVSGGQTVSTCLFGYDGNLHVGFKVDAAAVPDPEAIVAGFAVELAALEQLTHVP